MTSISPSRFKAGKSRSRPITAIDVLSASDTHLALIEKGNIGEELR